MIFFFFFFFCQRIPICKKIRAGGGGYWGRMILFLTKHPNLKKNRAGEGVLGEGKGGKLIILTN